MPRSQELEFRIGVGEWSWRAQLAVERKSERADTAYSPRFREEELPATANEHCRAQASLSDAANEQSAVINLLLLIRRERLARQGAFLRRPFPQTHSR